MSAAPQSPDEVASVVAALRAIDPRFDIAWNPTAVCTDQGQFDAYGLVSGRKFRGLWQLRILTEHGATSDKRNYHIVCHVTAPVRHPGLPAAMQEDGPYAPVGEWLIEFMRAADYANRQGLNALLDKVEAKNTRVERDQDQPLEELQMESLSKHYFKKTMEGGVSDFHPVRVDLT